MHRKAAEEEAAGGAHGDDTVAGRRLGPVQTPRRTCGRDH